MQIAFYLAMIFLATTRANIVERFEEWLQKFQVNIHNKRDHIFSNWVSNDEYIEEINQQNLSYTLAHNAYSGMSINEFSQYMKFKKNINYLRRDESETSLYMVLEEKPEYMVGLPSSVDWRTQGVVNSIKDQGQCGSCWAFSTVASVESAVAIKTGVLYSFSEQELVDCDTFLNQGCNGGTMDAAFNWIGKQGGLCTEADYPYVSGTTQKAGICKATCKPVSSATVKSHVDIQPNSDNAMMIAIAEQPVSVAIEADQRDFQLYSSGVFTAKCGTNLDHGVALVGYSTDYYILRNSWGTSWGDKGYMYLGKGSQYGTSGQCGVLMEGSYPIV
jgi:C1A family cysteine protease